MDPLTALIVCVAIIPLGLGAAWWLLENHDRFAFQLPQRERRGFDVLNVRPRRVMRLGYSFTEVMFAVVILGVGFIMVAAMLPVGISQQATTQAETNAAAIARGAVNVIEAIADDTPIAGAPAGAEFSTMPTTDDPLDPTTPAQIRPFTATRSTTDPLKMDPEHYGSWEAIRGNLIYKTDERFAFVPMYKRESGSSTAQVIIIATKVSGRPRYDSTDVATPAAPGEGNLQARPITVAITKNGGGSGIDYIVFSDSTLAGAVNAVAEGSYVVIADDAVAGAKPAGVFTGEIYRVGNKVPGVPANRWELDPANRYKDKPGLDGTLGTGDDYTIAGTVPPAAVVPPLPRPAYIVGREPDPTGGYRGLAQDVSVYSTFITVKP